MEGQGLTLEDKNCAVLFLDLRGSTRDLAEAVGSPGLAARRLEALLKAAESVFNTPEPSYPSSPPDFIKSTGDGFMCVWHLDEREGVNEIDLRRAILRIAVRLHSKDTVDKLKPLFFSQSPRIGIGLACGQVAFAQGLIHDTSFKDYFGFVPSLAAKLQDAARPEGLVVHELFLRGINPNECELKTRPLPSSCVLNSVYKLGHCYATDDASLPYGWTCLAWPGLAITALEEAQGRDANSRPFPVGLNTKGITVVTHEGLEGKVGTLAMWPRHESLERGDEFELVIDDFDALGMMHMRQSIRLAEPAKLPSRYWAPIRSMVCDDLLEKEEQAQDKFLFIPIRCGINALAADQARFSDLSSIKRYREVWDRIESGSISPPLIGLYDNPGATLPILLMMVGDIGRESVYSAGRRELARLSAKLRSLTEKHGKFRRYVKIERLALDLQSGRVALVPGGGAWLGAPIQVDGRKLQFHVPSEDGGFLWVEGAAVTYGEHQELDLQELKLLVEFLTSTVLEENYQWGLANGTPYGASPVSIKAIQRAKQPESRETSAVSIIDEETARIYDDSNRISQLLTHRVRPHEPDAWLHTWDLIMDKYCTLVESGLLRQ